MGCLVANRLSVVSSGVLWGCVPRQSGAAVDLGGVHAHGVSAGGDSVGRCGDRAQVARPTRQRPWRLASTCVATPPKDER